MVSLSQRVRATPLISTALLDFAPCLPIHSRPAEIGIDSLQDGATSLYMASQNGCAAVIERLIVARAEIETKLQARPRTRTTQLHRPFIWYQPDLF